MCAPMGLWLSTSVGPFCPAHLDGASYANEIPQNGPPAVIVQSNRGWNHPNILALFSSVLIPSKVKKGTERYRRFGCAATLQTEEEVPERTWRPVATRSDGYLTSIDAEHRWLCLLSEIEICDVYIYIYTDQLDQLEVAYGQPYAHTPWSHVRQPTAPLSGCPEVCSTSFPPRLAIRSSLAAPCVADI